MDVPYIGSGEHAEDNGFGFVRREVHLDSVGLRLMLRPSPIDWNHFPPTGLGGLGQDAAASEQLYEDWLICGRLGAVGEDSPPPAGRLTSHEHL